MRMHLNDRHLAKQLKQLRHDLTETLANLPAANSIAARDSVGDVGRNLQVKQEYDRSTDDKTTDRSNSYFDSILIANFKIVADVNGEEIENAIEVVQQDSRLGTSPRRTL